MEITRYLFQSPYSSQVQIGRPETTQSGAKDSTQSDSGLLKSTNSSLNNAESFKASQTREVKPTVDSSALLDIYA